jgi:2-amino-4-hydroxy-6-hydroxymethyldihydropteridine diphosphokinase
LSATLWHPAYVGLGSNLDHPIDHVRGALAELGYLAGTRVVARSRLYRSPPAGPPDQPDYVNAVAGLLTQLAPAELLAALQAVERAHGRTRSGERWGPRTLDLDLLLHGDRVLNDAGLELPHPRMHERAFVLVPLAEIAPAARVPGHGLAAALAARSDQAGLTPLDA